MSSFWSRPAWAAGSRALPAGAAGVVAGTRFVVSEESGAHPECKRRLCAARESVLAELFGVGWPAAPHRVVPNGAVERWGEGPPAREIVTRLRIDR